MGLTSRRKRPLDRSIPHLWDTRLVIIASEGEKTEKQYFESDLFRNPRVQVKVLETKKGFSAPDYVLQRLKDFARETDLQPDDELWLVVDKDRWPEQNLKRVCSHAVRGRKQKARIAVSNPCFELWLFLHHADWDTPSPSSRQVEEELRRLLGNYNKSNLDIERFQGRIEIAVSRAKQLDVAPSKRWPENPGTHVYRLVEVIGALERR
jgi:hypothetical protein